MLTPATRATCSSPHKGQRCRLLRTFARASTIRIAPVASTPTGAHSAAHGPTPQPRRGWAVVRIRAASWSRRLRRAAKGEDVVIVGVSGGVGGAVAQLARALGAAHVIGIARPRPAEGLALRLPHRCYVAADGDVAGVSQDAPHRGCRRT